MNNKDTIKAALYIYLALAPFIAIFLLFFARMDFLIQMLCICLLGAGFIALWIINRVV